MTNALFAIGVDIGNRDGARRYWSVSRAMVYAMLTSIAFIPLLPVSLLGGRYVVCGLTQGTIR